MPAILSLKVEIDKEGALEQFDKQLEATEKRMRSLNVETEHSTKVNREHARGVEELIGAMTLFSQRRVIAESKTVAWASPCTKPYLA